MSFDQIRDAWSDGKQTRGIAVTSADQVMDMARNWRRYVGL